jgi:hypothetical protein
MTFGRAGSLAATASISKSWETLTSSSASPDIRNECDSTRFLRSGANGFLRSYERTPSVKVYAAFLVPDDLPVGSAVTTDSVSAPSNVRFAR